MSSTQGKEYSEPIIEGEGFLCNTKNTEKNIIDNQPGVKTCFGLQINKKLNPILDLYNEGEEEKESIDLLIGDHVTITKGDEETEGIFYIAARPPGKLLDNTYNKAPGGSCIIPIPQSDLKKNKAPVYFREGNIKKIEKHIYDERYIVKFIEVLNNWDGGALPYGEKEPSLITENVIKVLKKAIEIRADLKFGKRSSFPSSEAAGIDTVEEKVPEAEPVSEEEATKIIRKAAVSKLTRNKEKKAATEIQSKFREYQDRKKGHINNMNNPTNEEQLEKDLAQREEGEEKELEDTFDEIMTGGRKSGRKTSKKNKQNKRKTNKKSNKQSKRKTGKKIKKNNRSNRRK